MSAWLQYPSYLGNGLSVAVIYMAYGVAKGHYRIKRRIREREFGCGTCNEAASVITPLLCIKNRFLRYVETYNPGHTLNIAEYLRKYPGAASQVKYPPFYSGLIVV